VDSQILQETSQKKIDLIGRLQGVLGGEIKPMVTQCGIRHLYDAEPKDEQLILQAKTYERRRCGHHELEKPLSSLECLSSCVDPKGTLTNKHRYVVATQDPKTRAFMRRIPGVPLIYISKSVMILEPMASATEDVREREERAKFKAGLKGRRGGAEAGEKRKRDNEDDATRERAGADQSTGDARPQKKKRVKGAKGPNPLSIRKSKKQAQAGTQNGEAAKAKPTRPEEPQHAEDDGAVNSGGEGEPAKRKRKRKHKPKGEGGVSLEMETEPAVS
jgi:U3 small nucleolar RNA-associated protein 23